MRRLRLSARGWAPQPSQLLAAGFTGTILGVALAALSVPRWLSLLGVALATAGLAILVATAGYRGMSDDSGRRLLLAALLFVVTAPLATFLWFHHPAVEVDVGRVVPQPGAPLTLVGVPGSQSNDRGSSGSPASLEATFGAMEIAEIGPQSSGEGGGQAATFHIRLPVAASACDLLEAEFGGACDESGPVLRDFEGFEIRTLRRAMPLGALILPRGARTIELIETTALTQQRVPTEWNLTHHGPSTDVELLCPDGAPLEVRTPYAHARAECAIDAATFQLSVLTHSHPPATLFLAELSELEADVSGSAAEAIIGDAELAVDGGAEGLPSSPVKIAMNAEEGELIALELSQSLESDLNEISFSSPGVSSVIVGSRELVPNWFEQHSELMYFVIGIMFATLIPALFDFILARWKRLDSDP